MNRQWNWYYVTIFVILLAASLWAATTFDEFVFNDVTQSSVASLLIPLFIIAAFLERAQEVLISAWRESGKQALKEKKEIAAYKATTQRIAFLVGISGGILISIAGVRVLHPLVSWDAEIAGNQNIMFDTVDIVLTGGLLGGGSDGIHRLFALITDFIEATRDRTKGKQ